MEERGHASEDAQGGLRVSVAARLEGGPARTQTPCALPLYARLLRIPQIGPPDRLRPSFWIVTVEAQGRAVQVRIHRAQVVN